MKCTAHSNTKKRGVALSGVRFVVELSEDSVNLGFGELHASYGDHIAHFYTSKEEWRHVIIAFLRTGLQHGDKCVYFMARGPQRDAISKSLEDLRLGDAITMGQLVFHEGEDDPEAMQARLNDSLSEVPDDYPMLRWGGDMTWSLRKSFTSERLMDWECHCNQIERSPVVFLCQYQLSAFPGSVIMDALKTHPISIVGNVMHRNPYFEEPESFLSELRDRGSATD